MERDILRFSIAIGKKFDIMTSCGYIYDKKRRK